jgi:DNA-binding NtrC family response regulator
VLGNQHSERWSFEIDSQADKNWHSYRSMGNQITIMKKNARIFIVDDDPMWVAILSEMLAGIGLHNITSFSNGADCLESIHLAPKIVFLDYKMDDLDGLKVLQEIKFNYTDITVIFCTAHDDLRVAVDALRFGSYDYLNKAKTSYAELKHVIDCLNQDNLLEDKIY